MQDIPTFAYLLSEWRNGNRDAADQLFAAAYQELRKLAAWHFKRERAGHTLQPTALVNELYIKLFEGEPVAFQDKAHFFAVAAQHLRRLLIDHARARLAEKREGGYARLSLTAVDGLIANKEEDLLELDQALDRLGRLDERSAKVVEFRFFGGLSELEAAEALGISLATLKRDWTFARAWLSHELGASPRRAE